MSIISPLLSFEDVSVVYPGPEASGQCALERLAFDIGQSEWVAVMGANGSGKSTLARLAVGLLAPTAGSIRVGKDDSFRIGYLSQHPEHHIVGLTVDDDLRLALEPLGLDEAEVARRIYYWLDRVGMAWALTARTDALSGGELQRVALAGVLARQADLLVLDEPNAYADPHSAILTARVIGEYVRASGASCLWITHSPEEAALADRVVVLQRGAVVFDGAPDRLWQLGSALEDWGIGQPGPVEGSRPGSGLGVVQPGADALLHMADLVYSYPGSAEAVLAGVDLTVHPGEAVALVGRSGAGKSTLLQVAAGLEPRHGGDLALLGSSIPRPQRGRRGRREYTRAMHTVLPGIGLAMQQPEAQLFATTVRDEITFGLRNLGVPAAEWSERIEGALDRVGLSQAFLDRSPFSLSGGERRKVALALCLAQRPQLYLFDEPTAGLDHPSRQRVVQVLRDVTADGEAGVLFATHDRHLVLSAASRVVGLEAGKIKPASGFLLERDEGNREVLRSPAVNTARESHKVRTPPADARALLVGGSLLALSVVSVGRWSGLIAAAAIVTALLRVTMTPWRAVRGTLLGLLPFMLIATVFGNGGYGGMGTDPSGLPVGGIFVGLRMFLTVVSLLWVGRVLTLSELINAFAALFRPLERLGLPLGTLLAATLVAMGMLPRLAEEAQRIARAQTMRGVQNLRGLRGAWTRVASFAIPLSAAALRRAERLGDALVLRGYLDRPGWVDRSGRLNRRDALVFVGLLCLAALVLLADRLGG